MKHTQGEWIYEFTNSSLLEIKTESDLSFPIATLSGYYYDKQVITFDELKANAKLISAAPKMLKALELAWVLLTKTEVQRTGVIQRAWSNLLMDKISKAIKNATT